MSRKDAERHVRRQYILRAARRLFAEKGVEHTTMEDIAQEAEYTRRTLYSYFKSLDEISLTVWIEDSQARWAEQQELIKNAKTGMDKLMVWGRSLYEFSRRNPQSLSLQLFWDLKGLNPSAVERDIFSSFEEVNNEMAEGLRDIFELGIKDRSMRRELNIDLCISQFLYSIRAIINRALSPSYSFAGFRPEKYIEHYLEVCRRAIGHAGDKTK